MLNLSTSLKLQSGVVLVISLVMLLLLTLIGITAMQTTSLEEKMAGNSRDQNIAFQAAEAALREAEQRIATENSGHDPLNTIYDGNNGLLDITHPEPANYFDPANWQGTNSTAVDNNTFALVTKPRYIIKRFSDHDDTSYFRITARAVGKAPGTQVILQSTYARMN